MICPLYRTRCLQLSRRPRNQTFCMMVFWVRKPQGGRREAEQAWPFFGRTALWSVCCSVPGVSSNASTCDLKRSPAPSHRGLRVSADETRSYMQGRVCAARCWKRNASIFAAFTEICQKGHSDRKSMTACCT